MLNCIVDIRLVRELALPRSNVHVGMQIWLDCCWVYDVGSSTHIDLTSDVKSIINIHSWGEWHAMAFYVQVIGNNAIFFAFGFNYLIFIYTTFALLCHRTSIYKSLCIFSKIRSNERRNVLWDAISWRRNAVILRIITFNYTRKSEREISIYFTITSRAI